MTKEEAIKEFEIYEEFAYGGLKEAIEVAKESMEKLIRLEKWMEENANE